MKKITLLSLAAATVLFTACGEDAKKAISDATATVTETIKDKTSDAITATTETIKEKTTEALTTAKDKVVEAATTATTADTEAEKEANYKRLKAAAFERESKAVEEAAKAAGIDTSANKLGQAVFGRCGGCHGSDGKSKALGKSNIIAGQSAEDIEKAIHGYKAGTRNVSGMGVMMKSQVAAMTEDEIKAVAEYISKL